MIVGQLLAVQVRFLVASASRYMRGLDDSHRALEPQPGAKTAGWLVGHMAVTGDFARRLAGHKDPICPKEWRPKFSPETIPSIAEGEYPAMAVLCDHFTRVYSDLAAALPSVDIGALTEPNPYLPALPAFPTAGEFLSYLATGHLSYHLGQLVAWRAAAGLGRIGK